MEEEGEIELLKGEIYRIKKSYFFLWDIDAVLKDDEFQGSYKTAVMAVLNDKRLNLNRLGFGLEWGTEDRKDKEKVFKALTQLKQGTLPKKDQPAAFDKLKSLTGNKPKKQEIVKKIPNKDAFEKLKGLKNKKIVTKRK